ncbi:MAG: agmatinase [Alphaproteobacteria bacterium]|nr:agmatinase [Alphaproteobacteria bacterium]
MTVPAPDFDYLPGAESFLDPEREDCNQPTAARAVVIPFGLEASVSYGGGTAKGPEAILKASHQLELYDEEFGTEPYLQYGIAALRPLTPKARLEDALDQLSGVVGRVLDQKKFPLVLGGEHSLTAGAIRPFAAAYPDLVVLQFDAHADLRDGYLGEHFSHASAMRRALDFPGIRVVSVGVRAISAGEVAYYDANQDRVTIHYAKDQANWVLSEIVRPLSGHPMYVTFDVDVFDGSMMPATGTPTPGGLDFWQAMIILRAAGEVGTIVGGDVVELAPIAGLHACDYLAAQVAYKLMSTALAERR